jgi:hypothetical protein
MKTYLAVLLTAAALASPGIAAEPAAPSTLLGAWAVDTTRLPMPAEARPKSVTITFANDGTDRLRTTVVVVDPSGERLEADGVTRLDGSPTPVRSNFEADVSATTMPRPDVLIMQLAKGGIPASTRIYVVEADGDSMIETVAFFHADGQPALRENHFSRIPQASR